MRVEAATDVQTSRVIFPTTAMLSPLVGCGVTQQKDEEQKEQNEQRGSGHGGKQGH